MRIDRVELRNYRRFARLSVELGPGLEVLSGPNGAGKSTLAEAMRHALFGIAPERPGEARGAAAGEAGGAAEVAVRFEQSGAAWELRRRSSAGGEEATLEPVLGPGPGARGAADVDRALAALMGLRGIEELRRRGALLATSAQRSGADLEALLGVDRYSALAGRVRALAAPARAELHRLEAAGHASQGDIQSYLRMSERLETARPEARAADSRAGDLERALATIAAETREMEERRDRLQAAAIERAVADETRRSSSAAAERARLALEEAERAQGSARKAQAAHARFEDLEAECRALELKLHEREDLRAEVARIENRMHEERAAIDADRSAFSERLLENQARAEALLASRDALRAELETLRGRARRAEGARNALRIAAERAQVLLGLVAHVPPAEDAVAPRAPDVERERREVEAKRAEREAREARHAARELQIAALRARARTEDDARARLNEARAAAERLERALGEARALLETLRPAQGACPFLQEPCQNIGGTSLLAHFSAQVEAASASREAADEASRFAALRVEEARGAARELADMERSEPEAGRAGPGAGAAKPAPPPRRSRAGGRHRLDFDEVGHHLFALSGVLAAAVPESGEREPVALIGAIAGVGAAGKIERRSERIEPPSPEELEAAQSLAQEGKTTMGQGPSAARDERLDELARRLSAAVRAIAARTEGALAEAQGQIGGSQSRSRQAEEALLESSRELETLALERARIRGAAKELSSKELKLLDFEIALTDRRMKLGAFERIARELAARRKEQEATRAEHETFRSHESLAARLEELREEWKDRERERLDAHNRWTHIDEAFREAEAAFAPATLERLAGERDRRSGELGACRAAARSLAEECEFLAARLAEMGDVQARVEALRVARGRAERAGQGVEELARICEELGRPMAEALRLKVELEAARLFRRIWGTSDRLAIAADWELSLERGRAARRYPRLSRGERAAIGLALTLALAVDGAAPGFLILDEPGTDLDPTRRLRLARGLVQARQALGQRLGQVIVLTHDPVLGEAAGRVRHIADLEDRVGQSAPD